MEPDKVWLPIHTLARDADSEPVVAQWPDRRVSDVCTDYSYERSERIVIVCGDQITYGDYVVECLLSRGYSEVFAVLQPEMI